MTRYNIKTDREPLSEADISAHMDFNKFISGHSAIPWLSKAARLWLSVSAGSLAILGTAYFLLRSPELQSAADISPAFINPPVESLKNDPDRFAIRAERDTSITYKTGSVITIPANSFVTKDGRDVKGPIEIRYLEFHDQIDQLLSGIPMHYDSAGTHYQFESAGMFDIMAYQDGEPLLLKEEKELTVDMASYNDRNEFNVYYLDTIRKQWQYDPENSIKDKKDLAELEKKYEQLAEQRVPETTPVVMPRKANPELENFTIDYNKEEFPELAAYDGVKFEVEKSNKHYKPLLAATTWEDVLIERVSDKKHYRITFTAGKTTAAFITVPVIDEQNFESAYRDYENHIRCRRKQLAKQADSINSLDSKYTSLAVQANGANARFNQYIKSGNLYRRIMVPRMGIWNSDAVRRYEELFALSKPMSGFPSAHFRAAGDGGELEIRIVYLIRKNANAICPIVQASFGKFPAELGRNADILVGITADKRVMYVNGQDLKKIDPKLKDLYFNMHEEKDGKSTIDQIRTMLDI